MTEEAADDGAYQRAIDGRFRADARFGFKLAYLRSFSVPLVARAVAAHGRLAEDPRGRAKRTATLVLDVIQRVDSDRSRRAAAAIRDAHRGVAAEAADYEYVLCCLLTTPIEFVETVNRRGFSQVERSSALEAYRRISTGLGLEDFPSSFESAVEVVQAYERQHGCWSPEGAQMAQTTLEAYTGTGFERVVTSWLVRHAYTSPSIGEHLGLGHSTPVGRQLARLVYRLLRSARGEAL